MQRSIFPRQLARLAAACALALSATGAAMAALPDGGVAMPAGWMVMALPNVRGNFRAPDSNDGAQLMYNQDRKLAAVVAFTFAPGGGGQSTIVTTFPDEEGTDSPPRLALLPPGDYAPACSEGGQCQPVHIANQAVHLCYARASCSIIYFDGAAYRDIAVNN
jgi:hypothetical protein